MPHKHNAACLCPGVIARQLDRDPARGLHQGQRALGPHKQAGQMTANKKIKDTNKKLANNKTLANKGAVHKWKCRQAL